jgi:Holliday junction resolvase RusA-like endonuclease
MIKIIIPRIPISLNVFLRMHWTKRKIENDLWKKEILVYSRQHKIKPIKGQVKITLRYFFPDKRLRDYDNYCGAAKPILDALKRHVIEEDNSRIVTSLTLKFDYDKENPRTEISIWEI